MQHKRSISFLTALVMVVCCIVSTAYTAKTAVPTEVSAASVYDEYREWSQLDSRWGSVAMGNYNIKSVGCLVTSLAIMAVASRSIDSKALSNMGIKSVENFNPGVLAKTYTKYNGFTWGGAINNWLTVEKIFPSITWGKDAYFKSVKKADAAKEIKSLMADGYHIIARVNNGGFHWVYIESVGSDGSITMCDPARDTHDLYAAYPNGLQGEYWALKGTNPPGFRYKAELSMEIEFPTNRFYKYGEKIDLTGGKVMLKGVDPIKGAWENKPVNMARSDGTFTVDTSAYDPYTPGLYRIVVNAETSYAKAHRYFSVKVFPETGEYYVAEDITVDVLSEQGDGAIQTTLTKGNVINFSKCSLEYGYINARGVKGWVDLTKVVKTQSHEHEQGDINADGVVDKYDLALLNSYLQQKEILPVGVSTLTAAQIKAADLNGDGKTDFNDVTEYLGIV